MASKVTFFKKINVRIIAFLILVFFASGIGVILLNIFNLRSIYEESLNEKVRVCNSLAASTVDAADIAYYVSLLSAQSREFKQEQVHYNTLRDELYGLADKESPRAKQLKLEMTEFHTKMQAYKKEDSYKLNLSKIKELKTLSKSKYLYIVAYTGVIYYPDGVDEPGEPMMTFIYDADDVAGDVTKADADGLGTTAFFEDFAFDIYKTKQPMEEALYYDKEPYGRLYYVYSPIIDRDGNVVAIVGTDAGITEMTLMLSRSVALVTSIYMLLVFAGITMIFYFVNKNLIKPIDILTQTSSKLAMGEVEVTVPKTLTGGDDEIGQLARSVDEMGGVYRDMITSTGNLFEKVMGGDLSARNDPLRFKGGISKVIEKINETLDATVQYLDNIPESLLLISSELKPLFKNSTFNSMLGSIEHFALMSQLVLENNDAKKADIKDRITQMLKLPDGVIRWINGVCYSVLFREIDIDEDSSNNILIIAVDVTALETEKMKALSASAAKSEFLSRVSHELRTPMNVIIGMSTIGLKEETNPKTIERLKNIDASSKHLLTIINDVLDMSRIESGKMEIHNEPFDIKQIIFECREMFDAQAAEKKIDFTISQDKKIPDFLDGDGAHIKQVLINLLSNSFKFTESGCISLSTRLAALEGEKAKIEIAVADTGIGMSEEFLKRIFDPFEQESVYLQRKHKGTGLGLSISKNLVSLMGGEILVESVEGKGSSFKINLDLRVASEKLKNVVSDTSDISVEGMRVLLVDDIEINRAIFIEMLHDSGIIVTEAGDGTDAVEIFEKSAPNSFDIIFMDIQMIKMDGYEATRRIRSLKRADNNVPIIAMTANALKQDVELALSCGMNGHISKPIDYEVCLKEMKKFFVKD